MQFLQKINPFFLRKRVKELEGLAKHYGQLAANYELEVLECHKRSTLEVEQLKRELLSLQTKYETAVACNASFADTNKALQQKIDDLGQQLTKAKRINKQWFEHCVSFGVDDFVLLNKALHDTEVVSFDVEKGEVDARNHA